VKDRERVRSKKRDGNDKIKSSPYQQTCTDVERIV
jgi:hypothetical protein